jgi:hypothetical protein
MPSTIKAFLISVGLLLLMMWLFSSASNPFTVEDHPTSRVVLLVAFGLTFAWVKHEFFSDRNGK